jgi:hypothetical protein
MRLSVTPDHPQQPDGGVQRREAPSAATICSTAPNSSGHVRANQCLFPVDGGKDEIVPSTNDTSQQPSGVLVNKIVDKRIHTILALKNKIPLPARPWDLNGKSHEETTVRLRLVNETTAPVTGKGDLPYRFGGLNRLPKVLAIGAPSTNR